MYNTVPLATLLKLHALSWLVARRSRADGNKQQVAQTHPMTSRTAADDRGGGYGVLMISDSIGAAEVIAMEKVRDFLSAYVTRLPWCLSRHRLS